MTRPSLRCRPPGLLRCHLAALVLLLGARGQAEDAGSDALLARIAGVHQALATADGRLSQRTTRRDNGETTAGETLTATFYLAFPDHYCLIYSKPSDPEWRHSFLSDGTDRWEIQRLSNDDPPDRKQARVGQDDAQWRRLLACFRFDVPVLSKDFALHAAPVTDAGAATTRVTLTPSTPEAKEQVIGMVLEFDKEDHLVHLGVDDPQGNHYAVEVVEAHYGRPIDPGIFKP
jgi:hypothetical protein